MRQAAAAVISLNLFVATAVAARVGAAGEVREGDYLDEAGGKAG